MPPLLKSIDHVHVSVANRAAAERWYDMALGLRRVEALAFWAPDGGPLTIRNEEGTVHLALFESAPERHPSRVAFAVDARQFMDWRAHLVKVFGAPLDVEDHAVSWSLYFNDPDGNPFEITSYDHEDIERALANTKS